MTASNAADFLDRLASQAAVERTTFNQCWQQLLSSEDRTQRFLAYMVEAHHYVAFTCPLLARFEDRVRADDPDLADYLAKHREEEADHDAWLLKDLARLGFNPESVRRSLPRRETLALVGAQLYMIDHAPERLGHLGYIYALESAAVPGDEIDRLADALGLPRAALSTFRAHGDLDPDHEAALTAVLARHVTTEADRAAVFASLEMSLRFLSELVLGLAMAPITEIDARLNALKTSQRAETLSANR